MASTPLRICRVLKFANDGELGEFVYYRPLRSRGLARAQFFWMTCSSIFQSVAFALDNATARRLYADVRWRLPK